MNHSTNGTNGHVPTPDQERIAREAVYYAARAGYYDLSDEAQRANKLTVSVFDMASMEPLPAGATHHFYIMIDATGYLVTRQVPSGPVTEATYKVVPHDQTEYQAAERELREAVLDCAVWYQTGEGVGYHPSQGQEARSAAIQALLADEEDQEYPVIREVAPDLYLSPGDEASPAPHVSRQWAVTIGSYPNYCEVGLIGYNDDGSPVLIGEDGEPDGHNGEGEDEEE
jgi:hypothetical protein